MEGQGTSLSVVVCTRNGGRGLERALRSVLSQDRLRDGAAFSFEVIVVDDGDGAPIDLTRVLPKEAVPALREQVRVLRTVYRGMGAARSEGFDAARGNYVAWCDEDDEWTPGHLSSLLGYLFRHPEADLVYGDAAPVGEDGAVGLAPSVDFDPDLLAKENFILPSASVFRAGVVHEVGGFYPWLQAHEDWDLWLRLSRRSVLRHLRTVVARRHASPERDGARDHGRDFEWVTAAHRRRLGLVAGDGRREGHDADIAPNAGPPTPVPPALEVGEVVPFDPESWGSGRRELAWHSVLRADEGYGTAGRNLLLALERRGVEVAAVSTVPPDANAIPRGLEKLFEAGERRQRIGFYYSYKVRPSTMRCEKLATYSMWESTLVPRDHVEEINRASSLHYVPCRQNVESHRACGVRVPTKVLHHGVDTDRFPYLERDRRSGATPYTFGTFGDLSTRKGIDVLVRAFLEEFGPLEPVRLLLKSTAKASAYGVDDPRVETVGGYLDGPALLETLREMDAFVLPSRGEGFGLCGLEAMATGLPLIATDWSGPSEYLDPADGFGLRYDLTDAGDDVSGNVRYHDLWAEPVHEHLREVMRHLSEHPGEGEAKGRAAAERVRRDWTWDRVAAQLIEDLDELAHE